MFIFQLATSHYPANTQQKNIAINPKSVASILQEKNDLNSHDNLVTIVLNNGRQYTVYYADFDTLVRLVSERC